MTRQDMERRRTARIAGKEQQYIDVGADPDTARLAAVLPDAKIENRTYAISTRVRGYKCNRCEEAGKPMRLSMVRRGAKNYAANNVKKSILITVQRLLQENNVNIGLENPGKA